MKNIIVSQKLTKMNKIIIIKIKNNFLMMKRAKKNLITKNLFILIMTSMKMKMVIIIKHIKNIIIHIKKILIRMMIMKRLDFKNKSWYNQIIY